MKILVLCHGNINRSPFSAAAMRLALGGRGEVQSAGFVNPGLRAAKKMRDLAFEYGLDLSEHRSQVVTRDLLRWPDRTVLMDGGNYKRWIDAGGDGAMNFLGEFANPPLPRIPDPAFMKRDSELLFATVRTIFNASAMFVKEYVG